jgi:GTP-binding protein Era
MAEKQEPGAAGQGPGAGGGEPGAFKSGFVSIIGRPNAGKSTLLNALVGQKVAIVADQPQTTRTSIQGVATTSEAQIVFLDTPGIHKADSPINKRMMDRVRDALVERDLLLLVVDAARGFRGEDAQAVDLAKKSGTLVVLVLNKVDLLKDKGRLLPLIEHYKALGELRHVIVERLPEGPAYFPDDYITDQPERYLAAELVREKVLQATRQEVPHAVAVTVDRWEEAPEITRIYATVRVERPGQKAIIIGTKGATLKKIGTLARQEMERIFGVHVYLNLHVRVQPGWREQPAFLNALDWRTMAGEDDH